MKRYGLGSTGMFDITRPISFNLDPNKIPPLDPSKVALTPTTTTAPAPTQSWLDKILNVGTKVTNFANQAASTVQNVQNSFNPQQPTQPQVQTVFVPGQGNQQQGMSTAAKVGIVLGVAALVGTVVYLATGKKKK